MYAWPVLFPAQTNREDLVKTVSLFDDDTGEPIDLSGRTLAAAGNFTGAAWTVTTANALTTSVTQLTIPDYPIQNELQAVALNTADLNLNIAAGDPVTIADTATGLNTITGLVVSYAPATGALVVQAGASFDFEIRGRHHHDSYSSWWDPGETSEQLINLTLGSGISIIDVGVIQIRADALTMQTLHHRTYDANLVMYFNQDTRQIFVGKLPVLSGGVPRLPAASSQPSNPFGLP